MASVFPLTSLSNDSTDSWSEYSLRQPTLEQQHKENVSDNADASDLQKKEKQQKVLQETKKREEETETYVYFEVKGEIVDTLGFCCSCSRSGLAFGAERMRKESPLR